MKHAIVYDRWLHSMGGGEMVACSIAKILEDSGYKVLFISGKKVSPEIILDKLNIDLRKIEFEEIWNDETALKRLSADKDLFINTSFMDYSRGFAKKNIYYTHFPTKTYTTFKGLVFNLISPLLTRYIKPIESMNLIDAPLIMRGYPSYKLNKRNRYAIYNLLVNKAQIVEFSLLIENLSKYQLEAIELKLQNAKLLEKTVKVLHKVNILTLTLKFIPDSNTCYLDINVKDFGKKRLDLEEGNVYLLYPKVKLKSLSKIFLSDFFEKFRTRLRAGIFVNIGKRLGTYQLILANSNFTKKWIKKYWNRKSTVLYPPVSLLFENHKISITKKKNWICSVGRFFTLGHGKKQEILIEAFKKLYDKGGVDWELHLVGGLGSEPSSLTFFQYLKERAVNYPIYFHINVSRNEVEDIYRKSKIYWHATGFKEDENYRPIRLEHFGISPIEAISAGCIPILYKGGGLPEIIKQINLNPEDHLFASIEELCTKTKKIIKGGANIDWQEVFSTLKDAYSLNVFKKNLLDLINGPTEY